ncbi:nucleoside diphosphate kinase homolog 5-like [Centruroides sculpturatus]|uniref:nucleoside diphosphate kinase homolog 5-like n=1 Tax=Centruroides sculpturatus TaxID=218467 RepID=UPI000C6D7086|nr:nucleoside diphosphate kinase homolog 5-like [Centruroides sculpturatus]
MAEESKENIYIEQTLAIIKPNAFDRAEEIEDIIRNEGFIIIQRKELQLTPDEAAKFYAEHEGKPFFENLVVFMSSGPIVVMVLAKENAITHWRHVMGPTKINNAKEFRPESIRALYSQDDLHNAVHGSDSITSAEREIHFFFPGTVIDSVLNTASAHEYLAKSVNPTLLKGLVLLCKNKPENPIIWLADWLLANNPYNPQAV